MKSKLYLFGFSLHHLAVCTVSTSSVGNLRPQYSWWVGLSSLVWVGGKDGKRLETMRRSRSIRPTVFDWIREDQSGKKRLLESAKTGILVLVGHVYYAR